MSARRLRPRQELLLFTLVGCLWLVAITILVVLGRPASARDYGQHGEVFRIVEPDFLRVIETKLRSMEASGETARRNDQLVEKTKQMARRPKPVAGITRATEDRSWTWDPSIVTRMDIRDHKGRLIFAKGTRVNPLDKVPMRQSLVFLNGDDPEQVRWALSQTKATNAMLILTGGDIFANMKSAQRRFFFDQGGDLTSRFGIRHVPAVVQQEGQVLRVTELDLAKRRGKAG